MLFGWLIDAHVLEAFSTGAVAMKTNAAVGVVMAGVAVLLKVGDPPRRRRLVADGLGLACMVLGLVTLAEYVTGWQPGIDELLFSEALTAVRTSSPNRMAASAALSLVLLGAAVVLMGRGRRRTAAAQCLAGVVAVLAVLALVGYGYGSSLLYQWRRSTAAAIPAGIAFLLLGTAVVVAGRGPPLSLLTSRGPGGMLARRLLPLVVVIPLGIGLLLHVAGEQGWADTALQTALAALVTIVLLTLLTLAIGLRLDRADAARAAATAELVAVNAGLEREVQARTEALRDSEELFRGAAESMFDPFAIMVAVRDEAGTIIDFEYQFANASAAGDLDPDDVAGRGLLELFPFHRDVGVFDAYVRLVDTGEPLTWESWWATLPGENQPRAFDTRATRFRDGFVATWREVTARELAAREIRHDRELLARVFGGAPVAIALVGLDPDTFGRFADVNDEFVRLYSRSRTQLSALTVADVTHPDDRPETAALFEQLREAGSPEPAVYEKRIVLPDGQTRHVRVHMIVVRDPADRPLVLEHAEDVTERRQAEEALARSRLDLERRSEELARSNRDLEQFAYVASHDLQEPLRMVSSYTTLLAEDLGDNLDDSARRYLHYAHDGAERMHQLVNDLLRFSRVGRADTSRQRVDCGQLVETATVDLHEAIVAAGATVTHDRLPTVMGVPTELGQLFTNLVGNAVKFGGDEPVHVHVSAARDGSMWQFSVADNGIGIDPAQAERIFEVFKRLHQRGRYPGTGIGLAICKKVVEHHGGRIWVESQPGTGATFRFTLPAAGNDPEDR